MHYHKLTKKQLIETLEARDRASIFPPIPLDFNPRVDTLYINGKLISSPKGVVNDKLLTAKIRSDSKTY